MDLGLAQSGLVMGYDFDNGINFRVKQWAETTLEANRREHWCCLTPTPPVSDVCYAGTMLWCASCEPRGLWGGSMLGDDTLLARAFECAKCLGTS